MSLFLDVLPRDSAASTVVSSERRRIRVPVSAPDGGTGQRLGEPLVVDANLTEVPSVTDPGVYILVTSVTSRFSILLLSLVFS